MKNASATRHYRVGGIPFMIELESPWIPMEYTEPVKRRIENAAAGLAQPVLPVRAGDKEPYRTLIQSREEFIPERTARMLDLSAIEPFLDEAPGNERFRLVIHDTQEEPFDTDQDNGLILEAKDSQPYFKVYRRPEGTWFKISSGMAPSLGCLLVSKDLATADYYPASGMSGGRVTSMLDMVLRVMFSYIPVSDPILLFHSSVIAKDGEAVMFLGASGTGKSTHSRLWLENIPGTELVNDDNPVVRIQDGKVYVYGTPWSGKTPCYRNIRVPLKAIVRLCQAPENSIARETGIHAYAALAGSVSQIRWERKVMDATTAAASRLVATVPVYSMRCLPDPEAASVCGNGIGMLVKMNV